MGKLENKIALITGSTSGIGEAIAKLFAKQGAEVVVVGRNKVRGKEVVDDIINAGGVAEYIFCDVTNTESVFRMKEEFLKKHTRLDILVNNAGILLTSTLEDISDDDWMKVFDANTHATMRVTREFISLVEDSQGTILNNASIDGLHTLVRGRASYAYCASKSATIKFTQLLALNYAPKLIRVNCLCPGVTETPFFTNQDFSRFLDAIPLGRVGQPEEIAKAALFLVSDDASYISGAVLTVDGAASLK